MFAAFADRVDAPAIAGFGAAGGTGAAACAVGGGEAHLGISFNAGLGRSELVERVPSSLQQGLGQMRAATEDRNVIKTVFVSSVLATTLLFIGPEAKATLVPTTLTMHGVVPSSLVEKASWLCGTDKCVWVHHHVAVVPAFAAAWPAPINPNCFWRRGVFGRWRFVCR